MSNNSVFMLTAMKLASESKCVSKQVGCVIVYDNRIVSSGVNGTPPGHHENCCDVFDKFSFDREAHHKWSIVNELHAEANALAGLLGTGARIKGATMYLSMQPCTACSTLIAASKIIDRVVFFDYYDKGTTESIDFLRKRDIIVEQYKPEFISQ